MSTRLSDYDFDLPESSIAQLPAERRDMSRLLVLQRDKGSLEHRHFRDLQEYLNPGDLLVLNDTKVIPARLYGHRPTGGKVEVLLLQEKERDVWVALARPGKKLPVGSVVNFGAGEPPEGRTPELTAEVLDVLPGGERLIRLTSHTGEPTMALVARLGELPLPPYISGRPEDPDRYQTVYARHEGAVAAPTAGLHFTPELLAELEQKGIKIARVTLHTGLGTFKPVMAEDIREHPMHAEWYSLPEETAQAIRETRARGGRVVAVGTTVARTLEHVASEQGGADLTASSGETRLFIYPGYRFQVVDALVTNFHLPKSTLLMLVSAFIESATPEGPMERPISLSEGPIESATPENAHGRETLLEAYRVAIAEGYRFYSFGDAMFLY
ncbi:S-adenosylmethionine:tRNA ribosyltransferase-isomerase [compost metagenome]